VTGALRRWLGLGPGRAELAAEAELWRTRCERASEQNRQEGVRAKAAERQVRALGEEMERQARKLQAEIRRLTEVIEQRLAEPGPGEGCTKIRFHREPEAADFLTQLAGQTRSDPDVYRVYRCRLCPRSPVTMTSYFHVSHRNTSAGRQTKQDSKEQWKQREVDARKRGTLLSQRVSPADLARLRAMARPEERR
jgi:hypothetical protein